MKRKSILLTTLLVTLCILTSCTHSPPVKPPTHPSGKKYDLVLIHGLTNKHQWSELFLNRCLEIWGSENVYAIYNNSSTRIWYRWINGRKLICCGENDFSAGDDYIEVQSYYMHSAVVALQHSYKLDPKFSVIAHSMGGLVSRHYIYKYPNTIAGLVTLGTPHHGSPLANSLNWAGIFIGAKDAMNHLKPEFVEDFNNRFPVIDAPLADEGRVYTIRGDGDGWDCFGWGGELFLGWAILRVIHGTDSDGLVPTESAVIDGAVHISDFWGYDHYDLVEKSKVVENAAEYLR